MTLLGDVRVKGIALNLNAVGEEAQWHLPYLVDLNKLSLVHPSRHLLIYELNSPHDSV